MYRYWYQWPTIDSTHYTCGSSYRSIRAKYTMMLSPQWECRSEGKVHTVNAAVHSSRKLLVHTVSCTLCSIGTGMGELYWYGTRCAAHAASGLQYHPTGRCWWEAARSARHAMYRADRQSKYTVGMLRSTLGEESGPHSGN